MIEVVIHEGRNQIVRRMFDALGYPVERLIRTAIGSIKLGELPPGKWRSLNSVELLSR
jgi:23S rRNA pseudouridine2605 synthase